MSLPASSLATVLLQHSLGDLRIALGDLHIEWDRTFDSPLWGVLLRFSQVVAALLIGLVLLALIPERMERIQQRLSRTLGQAALAGLGLLLGIGPALVLLAISLLGIPFIPLAIVSLLLLLATGLGAVALWIGRAIRGPVGASPWSALIAGYAVIALVALLPALGGVALLLASFTGAGAVLLARFGRDPAKG